jgi:hypothetical protein
VRQWLFRSVAVVLVAAFPAPRASFSAPVVPARATPPVILQLLRVETESSAIRYDRKAFRHWVDADRDCQNTRVEVLVRDDLTGSSSSCRVASGRWFSWLDGEVLLSSRSLDVDHLVSLAEAWRSGASSWTDERREAFANDLGYEWSLRAVSSSSNRSKSDKDPSGWLPVPAARCDYLTRWMLVKYRWGLAVDPAERSAISRGLSDACRVRVFDVPPLVDLPGRAGDPSPLPGSASSVPVVSGPGSVPVATRVTPGAFCSPSGSRGRNASGVEYVCRTSPTDTRNRWRRP